MQKILLQTSSADINISHIIVAVFSKIMPHVMRDTLQDATGCR